MSSEAYDLLVHPLADNLRAVVAGSLVAIVCGVIGCFIILRRMAFLGDALSHTMLAGVTAGYLFMKVVFGSEAHAGGMVVGAVVAGFVTVALIGFVTRFSRIKEDTAIGIMYTGLFALGGMLASLFSYLIHIDLVHFLMGQVLVLKNNELWMMTIVTAVVLAVVILFYRQLQLTSFDPIMAASIGIPVLGMNYLLTACTSLVVVSAVQVVGAVMVVGLLVTPAATAHLLCDRLSRMLVVSAACGVVSIIGGLYLADWLSVAPGSAIVVFSTLEFLVVLAVAPRYGLIAGWLRRRGMVSQHLVEDVLGCIRRGEGRPVPVGTVLSFVPGGSDQIHRAIRLLVKQDWIEHQNGGLVLTEMGKTEARRLLRAHRLWEAYLEHVGTPAERLHDEAHRLEHLHDEETVDYLDDKLGHPLRDPHGAEIPEDFVHLVPGHDVKASLLREGHRGVVTAVDHRAAPSLRVGMRVTAGPRVQGGQAWTLTLPDGREVTLDHNAADAVTIRLDDISNA